MSYIDIFRHIDEKLDNYEDRIVCLTDPNYDTVSNFKWKNCIGYEFEYSFQGLTGNCTIVDVYCKRGHQTKLTLFFEEYNKNMDIHVLAFRDARFGGILRIHYYKYNLGQVVKNKELLDADYNHKNACVCYKYRCVFDDYIDWIPENKLSKSEGYCPVCLGQVIVPGVNDIVTTEPWMVKYFAGGAKEASLYARSSNKRIRVKCPDCGKEKYVIINSLYRNKTIYCECKDNMSFPEKYMMNFLNSLNIQYVYQCGKRTLDWLKTNHEYDFYIPEMSLIIETHGAQHYNEKSQFSKWNSLSDIQENDNYKRSLAIENGIQHYIEIDSSKSTGDWMKNSLLNSELPSLLSFTEEDVDWLSIEMNSVKNKVKEICEYKNLNEDVTLADLAEQYFFTESTIKKYLDIGAKYGWCKAC